jgi:adenylate kinase
MEVTLGRPFIFLDPPGAGKGTHSQVIAKNRGVPHLSTGEMFREATVRGTDTGRSVKPIMERGKFAPDDIVMNMV